MLGPCSFFFYINDLPERLDLTVRPFADDKIMYLAINLETDSISLQNDLGLMAQ